VKFMSAHFGSHTLGYLVIRYCIPCHFYCPFRTTATVVQFPVPGNPPLPMLLVRHPPPPVDRSFTVSFSSGIQPILTAECTASQNVAAPNRSQICTCSASKEKRCTLNAQ